MTPSIRPENWWKGLDWGRRVFPIRISKLSVGHEGQLHAQIKYLGLTKDVTVQPDGRTQYRSVKVDK